MRRQEDCQRGRPSCPLSYKGFSLLKSSLPLPHKKQVVTIVVFVSFYFLSFFFFFFFFWFFVLFCFVLVLVFQDKVQGFSV